MLCHGLKVNRAEMAGLVARTGRWPVLCALVNGILRRRVSRGGDLATAIRWTEERLDAAGPAALDIRDPTARELAIETTMAASLDMLAESDPYAVDRYRELGVFPSDIDIPLETLIRYWRQTGNTDQHEAERLCHVFLEANLIDDFRLDSPAIRIHDIIAAYLRHDIQHRAEYGVATLNRALLDGYRTDLPDTDELGTAWWQLSADEPYLWRHLAPHLHGADLIDELCAVLQELRWASAKTYRLGAASVEEDTALLPNDAHARALGQFVRGTSHLYQSGDPMALTVATFAGYAAGDPMLATSAMRFRDRLPRPHLRPTAPPLPDQPHPAVSRILTGHFDSTDALVVAPDGSWLASTGGHDFVRVWNPTEGVELFSLPGSQDGALALAVAPDGSWLASGGTDGLVRVWDMPEGTESTVLRGHNGEIDTLAVAPDGSWLASAGDDAVRIWNAADGTLRVVEPGHTGKTRAMVAAPDGSWLAFACETRDDGAFFATLSIFRLADHTRLDLESVYGVEPARALVVAPDGSWLASTDFGQVKLWNPNDGGLRRILTGHSGWVSALAVAPDGSWLATAGEDGIVRLWNPVTGDALARLTGHSGQINALAVAPDGSWLASAAGDDVFPDDSTVRIWNLADRTTRAVLTGHSTGVTALAVAPLGSWLATAANDHTIRLWNTSSDYNPATITGHTGDIEALVVAPDGSWAATASIDTTVRLWNTTDGTQQAILEHNNYWIAGLILAPDGSWLAAYSLSGTFWLWDTTTATAVAGPIKTDGFIETMTVARDGSWLASAESGNTVQLWDPADGTLLGALQTQSAPSNGHLVRALASAPDGSWVAFAGSGSEITLWNVRDGTHKAISHGHPSRVDGLVAAPDGSWLATTGRYPYTTRIWNTADVTQRATVHNSGDDVLAVAPDGSWLAGAGRDGSTRIFNPDGHVSASIRLNNPIRHCAINLARPQLILAGSTHLYILDICNDYVARDLAAVGRLEDRH